MNSDLFFVGKKAYYWGYIAPLVRAYSRLHGTAAPVLMLDSQRIADPPFTVPVNWKLVRTFKRTITFDVKALFGAVLHGKRAIHVHHSLAGKGSAFKGTRPFLPFYLASSIVLPHKDRLSDIPASLRSKSTSFGHIPFDWLGEYASEWPDQFHGPLNRWREAAGKSKALVALLCTQGKFGAISYFPEIVSTKFDGCAIGVKLHGYIDRTEFRLEKETIDLEECPTSIVCDLADIVITDHCSAALEAHALGKVVFVYESDALLWLMFKYPRLSELRYLEDVRFFQSPSELLPMIAEHLGKGDRGVGDLPDYHTQVSQQRASARIIEWLS